MDGNNGNEDWDEDGMRMGMGIGMGMRMGRDNGNGSEKRNGKLLTIFKNYFFLCCLPKSYTYPVSATATYTSLWKKVA